MAIWEETKRSEVFGVLRRQALTAHKFIALAQSMAAGAEAIDLRRLLTPYQAGVCGFEDHLHHQIRDLINATAAAAGVVPPGGSVFERMLGVRPDILASICPELASSPYSVRDNSGLERVLLLESGPNELADDSLPAPMNMVLYRAARPAVEAYASGDVSLYVHPFQYQLLSRDQTALWASGSPRALSRRAVGRPDIIVLDRDVVLLQDRFNGTNFAHFLYDSVTRALLLRQRSGTLDSALLVFGGIPGEFHDIVCQALASALELDRDAIYFPGRPVILQTRRRCFWFSDQVDAYLHPAQMAHPVSIGLLRGIARIAPADTADPKRIYVSRADAERRRVVNEESISALLARQGFVTVELGRLPIRSQIGLFRNAEIVVAPHGMGLTHLAFSERLKAVVELFPPGAGTDAYAFVAKALGARHGFVLGRAAPGPAADFSVGPDDLLRAVAAAEAARGGGPWRPAGSGEPRLTP